MHSWPVVLVCLGGILCMHPGQAAAEENDLPMLRTASVQMAVGDGLNENLARILRGISEAAAAGARVVVFPETALSGFRRETIESLDWQQVDAAMARVAASARDRNLYVVYGCATVSPAARPYNSAIVVGPDGEEVCRYHKSFPESYFEPGGRLALFEIDGVPCTVIVCHDNRFPELVRVPTLAGARVCFYISYEINGRAGAEAKREGYRAQSIARAVENGIWWVQANGIGPVNGPMLSLGNSVVVRPGGQVAAQAPELEDAMLVVDIDPKHANRGNPREGLKGKVLGDWWRSAVDQLHTETAEPERRTGGPRVWMTPPSSGDGQCFRELMTQPEGWRETRALVDVLCYADHMLNRQFTDEELGAWLPRIGEWGLEFGLEVGAVKPWGKTGQACFEAQRPMWDRFERLGARIAAIALDEPLCCTRKDLSQPDGYAAEETAQFIALTRKHFPEVRIGDIEPYPYISADDLVAWIDALQARLAELGVRGMDFFRLDVDWVNFTLNRNGGWPEVRRIEEACRARGIPFGLIYWAADYPHLERLGLADDATWYVSTMRQGNDYAVAGGRPDELIVQSWVGAPSHAVPERQEWTFTRSVRDFARRFAGPGAVTTQTPETRP